jgi:transcriptional regulator with XRE-family HTH domain
MPVRSTLFEYWRQKEIELGRRLTVAEVARATGLERNTVKSWLDNRTTRYDQPVLDVLCEYFQVPDGEIPFLRYERRRDKK